MYSVNTEKIAFNGKTRFLSCNSEGKSRRVSDCPFGTAYFGETRGLSEFVKKHSYPNATIEETIGKVHDNKTYRVYVADPKEFVTDSIKQNHDYVVYDMEPNFPDIKQYFEKKQEDIKKEFKFLSEYYKRLETAGKNFGDADKVRQKVAEVSAEIFNEGDDLRTRRNELETKINARFRRISEINENIPNYQNELERKRKFLASNELSLEKKETTLSMLKQKQIAIKDKINVAPDEIDAINSKIKECEQRISGIKCKIEVYTRRIEFLEQYIENAPKKISEYLQDIKYFQKSASEIKKALIPNFKKLQDFYTINGIKIIKHI